MSQATTLNGKNLHQIAHCSDTAQRTMLLLATRERVRTFSDIQRTKNHLIRMGEKIVESDYLKFWEQLQAAGVGTIVYGRKASNGTRKPDRFQWHYSLKAVGKAAIEGTDQEVSSSKQSQVVSKPSKVASTKVLLGNSEKTISIPIRSNLSLELKYPSDLSKEEVEFINLTLKRLCA